MTTTEFEPINIVDVERVKGTGGGGRRKIRDTTLDHPSGTNVLADWCEVAVPYQVAKDRGILEDPASWVDIHGKETPAVLRRIRGRQSVFFDVLAEFGPDGTVTGSIQHASPEAIKPTFRLHPNLANGVLRMPSIQGIEPDANRLEILAQTAAVRRMLARYPLGGNVWGYVECIIRSMDPVVTFNVSLRRRMLKDNGNWAGGMMDFGPGAHVFEPLASAEEIKGLAEISHRLDWGTCPTWTYQVYYDGAQRDPITAQAQANAGLGEPSGMFEGWGLSSDARWFAFGVRPRGRFGQHEYGALHFAAPPRSDDYNARRPMSQALNAGQGGAQRFGQTVAGWALDTGYRSQRLLRLVAEDELLRPVHWIDGNGRSLKAADRPGYLLVDREYHAMHSRGMADEFGGAPPQVTPAGKRTTDDVLHVDDVALAAYLALYDDCWAIEDCYRQIVEREAAAVRLQAGWFTRARGFGRCTKSMADAAWLFEGEDTARTAVAAIGARLHIALGQWKGRTVTDPKRPVRPTDYQLDPRLLGGRHHGVIPYEEATVVAGLVAASHVLPADQRLAALGMAYHVANTIHALACRDDHGPWFAYGVGIPVGEDLGKLPPEGFDNPDSPVHADWIHGTRSSGWTRWSVAASYLLPYVCDALTELTGTRIDSPYVQAAWEVIDASAGRPELLGEGDELYRFSACPTRLDEAEYLEPVGVE